MKWLRRARAGITLIGDLLGAARDGKITRKEALNIVDATIKAFGIRIEW